MRIVLAIVVSMLFVSPMYAAASVIHLHLEEEEFALSFLPLSDGEAAFLHTADGQHFLINTGHKGTEAEIFQYMNSFQIHELDGLIITERRYWRESFIEELRRKRKLKKIFTGWPLPARSRGSRFIHEKWQEGDLREISPGVRVSVLYSGLRKNEGLDFSIRHYDSRLLWLSSASRSSEKKLLALPLRDSNIVKIPQFGKHDSLSNNLLTHIDPQTAVLFKQKAAYPDERLMELLHEMWIDIYYTGQHGILIVKFTKEGYELFSLPDLK
ncbi:hypothetical protein [Pseudobacillus wudalianchiensis]|uniref:ATP-dependent DNA helicase n=1 Tax=Pseudobacillus wudalianchiensis TaxID=1743143 RepID=A0A1B9B9L7_9BACI|nr:hypothetical protein [Bacillus wudalianchiensis]OCA92778.1 hypothetical protein A8F95_03565 [Bacillus wudalianchiensis]